MVPGCVGLFVWLFVGFWFCLVGLLLLGGHWHTPDTRPRSSLLFQSDRDCTRIASSLAAHTFRESLALWFVWCRLVGCLPLLFGFWLFVSRAFDSPCGNLLSRESVNDCPYLLVPPGLPFETWSSLEFDRPRLLGLVFFGVGVGLFCWPFWLPFSYGL